MIAWSDRSDNAVEVSYSRAYTYSLCYSYTIGILGKNWFNQNRSVMTSQVLIVLMLTFLINLITTLSYSVRIVGIRTGRIAISFALFNIGVLVSRTANGFQAPLLAKTVENGIKHGIYGNVGVFRVIIFVCTLATIFGAILVPTFQRVLSRAVVNFSTHKSMGKLICKSVW